MQQARNTVWKKKRKQMQRQVKEVEWRGRDSMMRAQKCHRNWCVILRLDGLQRQAGKGHSSWPRRKSRLENHNTDPSLSGICWYWSNLHVWIFVPLCSWHVRRGTGNDQEVAEGILQALSHSLICFWEGARVREGRGVLSVIIKSIRTYVTFSGAYSGCIPQIVPYLTHLARSFPNPIWYRPSVEIGPTHHSFSFTTSPWTWTFFPKNNLFLKVREAQKCLQWIIWSIGFLFWYKRQ